MSFTRFVSAELDLDVTEPTRAVLQLAVSPEIPPSEELLEVTTSSGRPLDVVEVLVPGHGRAHVVDAPVGELTVRYSATVVGRAPAAEASLADEIVYLRPSRYAEADRLGAVAAAEFAGIETRPALLSAVSSWVGGHLIYVPGSSRPTDGAAQTLLQREGVCRDYAHLVVALLRSLDVPARLAAVYAPGLSPMDFHAVAEAAIDGVWYVVDATLLAPRSSLLRISTGRDAADTAFLSTYGGRAEFLDARVVAITHDDLPSDDVEQLVSLG